MKKLIYTTVLCLVGAIHANAQKKLIVLIPDDAQKPSTTVEYASRIMTSNFTVPLIRFNKISNDPDKKGSLAAFNSVGAGVSLNAGRLFITTDEKGDPIVTKFKNTIGWNFGFLFSANTNENASNVFALTTGVSILNFQLGTGYELGSVQENQSRFFLTVAYNIPIHTLIKESFHVFTKSPLKSTDVKQGSVSQ